MINTTFHVYDNENTPVTGLINLSEEEILKKLEERKINLLKHDILRVESEDMSDASY